MFAIEADENTFQHQALEVCPPGADFDPNSVPQTGEEFLMKMIYERKKCPAIVVRRPKECGERHDVASSSIQMNEIDPNDPAECGLFATKEWKAVQVADFRATRLKVVMLRSQFRKEEHEKNFYPPINAEPDEWQEFCQKNPPLLRTALHLGQRLLEHLLELICEWLHTEKLSNKAEEDDATTPAAELDAQLIDLSDDNQWLGAWLYAVLACLHMPLEPNVHSTLRHIARSCIALRSRVAPGEVDKAMPYNLFISLIAREFAQMDFDVFV